MPNRNILLIIGAFAVIYIIWGSTYLVNFYAIETIPPFLMSGSRFVMAGLIMYGIGRMMGLAHPSKIQWRNAAISGILLLSVGTGGVVWAEQYVDTGIAALIVAADPLVVVLLVWLMRRQKPAWNSVFGIALSIIGVALLIGQDLFLTSHSKTIGIIVIFISIFSWAFATVFIGSADLPKSSLQMAATQMLTGGSFLLFISFVSGEYLQFDPNNISIKSILSWLYLLLFGSILAFSAFNYLLVRVSPEKVATSAYVNPVIAVFLGWWLNSEIINEQTLLAAIIILTGVFFINSRFKKTMLKKRKTLLPE
ncbi:MAG: EamA family transporter [Saprospiraceae bacterium]|nr:EamA family transporter [Saprospiraceae bacterium]